MTDEPKTPTNGNLEHRLTAVETTIAYLVKTLDEVKRGVTNELPHQIGDLKDNIGKLSVGLERRLEEHAAQDDSKFARKWVEQSIIWASRVVIGAVILALLALILKETR